MSDPTAADTYRTPTRSAANARQDAVRTPMRVLGVFKVSPR
jgi:predicted methyltransferase